MSILHKLLCHIFYMKKHDDDSKKKVLYVAVNVLGRYQKLSFLFEGKNNAFFNALIQLDV